MEEKLKAKIEELKKLCLEEGALSGQLPPEYPLGAGEAPPTIRRRVGTGFTLPENLLNRAKSSKVAINKCRLRRCFLFLIKVRAPLIKLWPLTQEESLAALELEYEIQRKITSAALRLSSDGSPSKAVKRQRKMIYQQSLQQLKVINAFVSSACCAVENNAACASDRISKRNCALYGLPRCTTALKHSRKCRWRPTVRGTRRRRSRAPTEARTRRRMKRPASSRRSTTRSSPAICTSTIRA